MRKPEPRDLRARRRAHRAAARALRLRRRPQGNLKPARAMGMATVHHVSADETIPQLEDLLGVKLGR